MLGKGKGEITTSGENYKFAEDKGAQEEVKNKLEENYEEYKEKNSFECEDEYLVRGAKLKCTYGSHKRGVNLPIDHGNKALGNPMLHENDCRVGEQYNITSFGVCKSETAPEGAETVILKLVYEEGDKKGPENVKGKLCTPMIIGTWMDTKEDTMITDNGTDNKYPAVSTHSFLVCACGGIIEPRTSGQECDSSKNKITMVDEIAEIC